MTITKKTHLQKLREVSSPGQMFWLAVSVCLWVYFPTLYNNAVRYTRYRSLELPDYPHESVNDFLMIIPYVMFIRILRFSIDQFTYSYFKGKLQKYEGEDLEKKIKKCSKGAFKAVYFSFTFLFGWLMVLRQTPFHPPMMLGSGNLMYVFSDWPFTMQPTYLKFYYILSISYYIEDLIIMLISDPNSDFWEMILHHQLSAMLIFASYMNGYWNIGIFVLMQMDIADVFVGIIRAVMDYSSTTTKFLIYAGIMSSWFYFRFIAYVYWVFWFYGLGGRVSVDNYSYASTIIDFLLLSLLGLNVNWFYLLGKMGYRLAVKKESVDLQNVVSQKDAQFNSKKHNGKAVN